jgi:L-ascorbate metabolism protein UlaG (beta-lactamase superfamily)
MFEIDWLGHSTVLLRQGETRILTDPVLRRRLGPLVRRAALANPPIPDVDAVLISHLHHDHLDLPSLRMLDRRARLLVPRGAGRSVAGLGFASVTELGIGETAQVGPITVTATPADHDPNRFGPFGGRAEPIGFLIEGEARVYFAGDTDIFDEMAKLAPGLDLALLPVWGWGPKLGHGHLDPDGAAETLRMLQPVTAIPIHWGTIYPRGFGGRMDDRLREPPYEFARAAARLAPAVEVRILQPGESTRIVAKSP